MDLQQELSALADLILVEQISTAEAYVETVNTYRIRYRSDEYEVEGFAAAPKNIEGLLPAVIFNRGGNREFGKLLPEKISRYAHYGYVVLGSQYRGNCGGTGQEEFGGSEVNDIVKLIDMALLLPSVRKEGVYMAGHSRGGMMTYLTCARDARIKAAAISSGLADSVMMYHTREQSMKDVYHELVGGAPDQMPQAFFDRSPVCWADRIIPPVLICQGTADWRVVPEQAYKMDRALTDAEKVHKLIIYEGADHSLQGTTYLQDEITWFREHPLN